jgi:hypothetical protein
MDEAAMQDLKLALSYLQQARGLVDKAAALVWGRAAVRRDDERVEYVSDDLYQAAMLLPSGAMARCIVWLKRVVAG